MTCTYNISVHSNLLDSWSDFLVPLHVLGDIIMPLKIVRNDITKMNTEAIVNTASAKPAIGAGCDTAVYKAAGMEELLKYRQDKVGYVQEGDVFITPGFNLQAKYIIHAVSPLYMGGDHDEEDKLRSCYIKSLALAKEKGIKSIAFPLISTGAFGYPKEEGMRIAVDEINAFLSSNQMLIYLVVFDSKATLLGRNLYPDLEAYIDHNYVEKARAAEYGNFAPSDESRSESDNIRYRQIRGNLMANMAPMPQKSVVPMSQKSAAPEKNRFSIGSIFNKEKKKSAEYEEKSICVSEECLSFEEQHESKLEERMKHLSDTFSEYLMFLIQDKKMENAEVWKRGIVDKKTFSKIKTNPDYHPQKLTALCLCIGAKLNLDESKDLLARAGYALSPCDKTDIIFSYFIENEIYDMIELDIQLEEHGLPCIIS